jgi:hypothetical protein
MSQEHNISGRAIHKSEEALNEVAKLRKELELKKMNLAILGSTIVIASVLADQICYILQIPYRPGINVYQIFGIVMGSITILWG